jgi:hypothetical protein
VPSCAKAGGDAKIKTESSIPDIHLQDRHLFEQTLRRARTRRFLRHLVTETGVALAVVAGLFCVLLVAGAQVLATPVLVLLALLGIGIATIRVRRHWLTIYETAQELDRTWRLPDTLSTSFYCYAGVQQSDERLSHLQPLIERQHQDAARAVHEHGGANAFPVQLARIHLVALVLFAVAVGLFAYRYMQSEELDLDGQLASLHVPFPDNEDTPPAMVSEDNRYRPDSQPYRSPLEDYYPEYDPSRERLDGTYNDMPPVTGINVTGEGMGENAEAQNLQTDSTMDLRQDPSADPRRQQGSGQDGAESRDGDKKQGNNKDSLFDKFQQAMSNMMDKFTNRQNETMEQRGEERSTQQAQNAGDQAGDGSDDTSNREGNQRMDNPDGNEGAQEGLGGQQAQDMGSQNASGQESAADSPSSAGAEDGAKKLQAERQMEAMGQIAEILGQRTENVKGEMKMEVEAQREQTLTTQLRNVRAARKDTGGEMSRDEVPLRLQTYVKEYLKAARDAEAAAQRSPSNQ